MHRILSKKEILTIPNLLSLLRILMIPLILWMYLEKQDYHMAALMIVISGITDVVDGAIARKFHMVSDFGKIIDPAADKLTQIAVILCLTERYRWMILLAILFAAKELMLVFFGLASIRLNDAVNSSQWYGKATTVFMYFTLMLLVLFPDISLHAANAMIWICIVLVIVSLGLYTDFYAKYLDRTKK